MGKKYKLILAAVVSVTSAFTLNARASRLGHPGVSTHGATAAQNQWNLLCDPDGATNGTTTMSYTAYQYGFQVAALSEVQPLAGFGVSQVELQVAFPNLTTEFIPYYPTSLGQPVTIDDSQFPAGVHETGVVQVFWQQDTNNTYYPASLPPPADGDVNTYELLFNNMSGVPSEPATFENYMDPGVANGGVTPTPDFYSGVSDGTPFTYTTDPTAPPDEYVAPGDVQVNSVTEPAPEPSTLAMTAGILCLGLLRRARRS